MKSYNKIGNNIGTHTFDYKDSGRTTLFEEEDDE